MQSCRTRLPASLNASPIVRTCTTSGSSPIGAPCLDFGSWPSSEAQGNLEEKVTPEAVFEGLMV